MLGVIADPCWLENHARLRIDPCIHSTRPATSGAPIVPNVPDHHALTAWAPATTVCVAPRFAEPKQTGQIRVVVDASASPSVYGVHLRVYGACHGSSPSASGDEFRRYAPIKLRQGVPPDPG